MRAPFTRRACLGAIAAAFLALGANCTKQAPKQDITIGAASSLRRAVPEMVEVFVKTHPSQSPSATYQSSGEIRRQLEAGADIDLVILAAKEPIDDLAKHGLVDPTSARAIATNELILVGPQNGPRLTFKTLQDLPKAERIAIGDPASVPAGAYAQKTLVSLGVWEALKDRLVLANNVAAVLAYTTRGEAQAAIVYRTEIQDVKGVVELDSAKPIGGPTPEIWAAITTRAPKEAREFLDFLQSPEAKATLSRFGFGPPPP